MSVDIVNVSSTQIKRMALSLFNEVNGTNVDVPLSDLVFEKSPAEGKMLLQNPATKSGVLLSKINIQDLFYKSLSISNFTGEQVGNVPVLGRSDIEALNDKHSTQLVVEEADILNVPTSLDAELVKKFILFCRVFGFYELGIGDVTLNMYDEKMVISVVPTHAVFTGHIEVRV